MQRVKQILEASRKVEVDSDLLSALPPLLPPLNPMSAVRVCVSVCECYAGVHIPLNFPAARTFSMHKLEQTVIEYDSKEDQDVARLQVEVQ